MESGHSLWDRLIGWENLAAAARDARRRKRDRPDVLAFEDRREENLRALRQELMAGTYRPGPYRRFVVSDTKRRVIHAPAYRDRVVGHAVVRVMEPLWERYLPPQSFACRVGRGTHAAVVYAQRLARRYPLVLKLDVARFYESVSHRVLKDLLPRTVPDKRVRAVLERIIDSYDSGGSRGVPIGALTSQHLALLMLAPLQHYVTGRLRVPASNYMDDHLFFGRSKAELRFVRDRAIEFLRDRLDLRAHPGKRTIHRTADGFPFLGFRIFPHHRRVLTPAKVRACRKMRRREREAAAGTLSGKSRRSSIASWVGHWKWADSYYLRKATIARLRF